MSQKYIERLSTKITTPKSKVEFYKKKFKGKSQSAIDSSKSVVSNFETFAIKEEFDIAELFDSIAAADKESREVQLIQLVNDFIEYLQDDKVCSACRGEDIKCIGCAKKRNRRGVNANTIRNYVSHIRKYLDYFGFPEVKSDMFFAELEIPNVFGNDLEPLTPEMFKELLAACTKPRNRLNLKFLRTNGCRPREMVQLKKSDLVMIDINGEEMKSPENITDIKDNPKFRRIQTKFRAETTKKKNARISWISDQIVDDVLKRLDEIDSDSIVFSEHINTKKAVATEVGFFQRIRKRLGKSNPKWLERFVDSKGRKGAFKYKLYSTRSMFITDCMSADKQGNLGHYLAGHKKYMGVYERLTPKKKLDLYNKAEEFIRIETTQLPQGIESEVSELRQDNIKLEDELFKKDQEHEAKIQRIYDEAATQRIEDLADIEMKMAELRISPKKKSK